MRTVSDVDTAPFDHQSSFQFLLITRGMDSQYSFYIGAGSSREE